MGRGLILIRQLASRGRLSPKSSFRAYPVLAAVSNCYPGHEGRLSTRYSPVRHSTRDRSLFRVRLACVKHAASVQSEPESNSPVQICIKIPAWQKSESQRLFLPTRYSLVNEPPEGLRPLPLFSAARCRFMHHPPGCVNNFFRSGEVFSPCLGKGQKRVVQSREVEDSHPPLICQRLFAKKSPFLRHILEKQRNAMGYSRRGRCGKHDQSELPRPRRKRRISTSNAPLKMQTYFH